MPHMKRNDSTTYSRRKIQQRVCRALLCHLVTFCSLPASLAAQDTSFSCPPRHSGWAPSLDCASYFWCSNGILASISYECTHGLLFDTKSSQCKRKNEVGVDCIASSGSILAQSGGAKPPPSLQLPKPSAPTPPPSPRPSSFGDAIYYMDFPSQTCRTTNKPLWVERDSMYTNKEECCSHLDWVPLQNCLGPAFVETNYVWEPTLSPTTSPTWSMAPTVSPTKSPSVRPSRSPTQNPTRSPTKGPTDAPTKSPTLEPTDNPTLDPTNFPTVYPTLAPFEIIQKAPTNYSSHAKKTTKNADVRISRSVSSSAEAYLVELLDWADDQRTNNPLSLPPESYASSYQDSLNTTPENSLTHNPPQHTSRNPPEYTSPNISELILPVIEDATISKLRPNANFGSHQSLAVDGGGSEGDKYDSLLKFDISLLLDSSSTQQRTQQEIIASVTLRLQSRSSCSSGGKFHASSSDWRKNTITWYTAPVDAEYGNIPTLGRLGIVAQYSWYEVDVTSILYTSIPKGKSYGDYLTIRISSDEASRCMYSSMENGEEVAPRLVVKYGRRPKQFAGTFATSSSTVQQKTRPVSLSSPIPPSIQGDFLMLRATDDATIMATYPTMNLGSELDLKIAFEGASYQRDIVDTIIQFDLSELQHTVPRSAVLSLFSERDCESAGTFTIATSLTDKEWKEDNVTWSTAPLYTPRAGDINVVGTFGSVLAGHWHGFTVTNALAEAVHSRKEDAVTFRITSGDFHPCQFSSRNGGRAPKLMVTF